MRGGVKGNFNDGGDLNYDAGDLRPRENHVRNADSFCEGTLARKNLFIF